MPCAIILAAGSSTRLGQPKQHVRILGETLLERAVRIAREAALTPVFIVLPPRLAHPPLPESTILINHAAAEGMGSSIRLGVRAAMETRATGAVILACDQVAVTADHLHRLCIGKENNEIVASSYAGRNGVPAYFPASAFPALLALSGDIGARNLLRGARAVPLVGGELDIDTPEDLARARLLYPEKPQ
jgi:molybdenum cofactor cytidylyltransferase/nicotine blue oxidoreductase